MDSASSPGARVRTTTARSARRPVYQELVAGGFPAGLAADDGVGLHFVGTELKEAVSVLEGANAYRVESGSETTIEARLL